MIVHGGAGSKRPSMKALEVLFDSLSAGYGILRTGGTALNAVVESIRILENSGLFNAGTGGNLQLDGVRRLDAALMEGEYLKAGSVVGLEGIRNPIEAARMMMEMPHVMMTNIGARRVALGHDLEPLPEPDRKILKRLREARKQEKGVAGIYKELFSTVGAVALDGDGNLAAGASTGGVRAMLPGRVGDTPVIGAGIYAENDLGAVSCTGMGESIIRLSLAKEISMNARKMPVSRAASFSLKRLLAIGGTGGVIVINGNGKSVLMHTTEFMASGYADKQGVVVREGFRRLKK